MTAGQKLRQPAHDLAGGAIAGIPADREPADIRCAEGVSQAVDIGRRDFAGNGAVLLDMIRPVSAVGIGWVVRRRGQSGEILDRRTEHRGAADHHLEAVMMLRVMRAGDDDAAIDIERMRREIEQRRGTATEMDSYAASHCDGCRQMGFESGRAQAPVTGNGDAGMRCPEPTPDHGDKGMTQGRRIGEVQCLADQAANVIFAQDRGRKAMRAKHGGSPLVPENGADHEQNSATLSERPHGCQWRRAG